MKYIFLFLIILISLLYIFLNRIFVWNLRRDKGSGRDKSPENIEEVKGRINIEVNKQYTSTFNKNYYDSYIPKDKENVPVIVWLHGGAFIAGDKVGTKNYGALMADKGYGFFSINYEWAPEKHFPNQLKQLNDFLLYLKTELSEELSLDTSKIILGGDSAGANIVANYAALCKNHNLLNKLKVQPVVNEEIKGLLLYCGPLDLRIDPTKIKDRNLRFFMKQIGWAYCGKRRWWKTNLSDLASPVTWINKEYPPAYIVDGNMFSFEAQGKAMVKKMKDEGIFVKSRFYEEKQIPHEFQFDYTKYPKESIEVFEDSFKFLEEVIK